MSWDFCFKLLDGGMFAIDLSNHRVNGDTIHDFAEWLEWELQRRRQAHNGGLWVTRGHVLAYAVDLSRNNLDDSSLEVLLKVLATARVAVGILKLHRNRLSCFGAGHLASWIRSAAMPLFELHLTQNCIETAGARQ